MAERICSVAATVCWLVERRLAMIRSDKLNRSGDIPSSCAAKVATRFSDLRLLARCMSVLGSTVVSGAS